MKKHKVIKRTQIATQFPIGGTVILWLLLDRYRDLPGWVVGAAWTLWGLI